MNVKPHHPLQELLAKLLFGIEVVPAKEQRKMVNRACKEAVKWHESQTRALRQQVKNLMTEVFRNASATRRIKGVLRENKWI